MYSVYSPNRKRIVLWIPEGGGDCADFVHGQSGFPSFGGTPLTRTRGFLGEERKRGERECAGNDGKKRNDRRLKATLFASSSQRPSCVF